jgi:hypothetical protein
VIAEELDRALGVAGGSTETRQQDLGRERTVLVEKRQRVVDAIANHVMSEREAASTMAQLRARIEAIEAELERLRFATRRLDGVDAMRERMLGLAANFESTASRATGPQLRELLRPWIANAVANKHTRILTLTIRRVPDVFGAPWSESSNASEAAAAGGIDSPVRRPRDRQNNTLTVVKRVRIPAHNAVKTECKHGHSLTGANLYRTPDGRRQCRTCRRNRERADTKRAREVAMSEHFRTGATRSGGAR